MSPDPTRSVPALERWKLTEPVLLYVLPVAVLLLLGAGVAGTAGEWLGAAMLAAGGLLVVLAGWAARVSTYSPAVMVQTALRARGQ